MQLVTRLRGLPTRQFLEFPAAGFAGRACGVIFDGGGPVVSGMPIGGVDTGCIDVETSGLLGYRTIFNSHVPRGGPINQPFLGMTVDSNTWVLTTGKAKSYHEPRVAFSQTGEPVPICEPAPLSAMDLAPARSVEDIVYWGHYPMLELEFVSEAPVAASATIWNPFIPGDLTSSTLPGAVFAVELSNRSDSQQEGHLIFSFPGPTAEEAGGGTTRCDVLRGGVSGISLSKSECQLAVGVAGDPVDLRCGSGLGGDGSAWARAGVELPQIGEAEDGIALSVPFCLPTGSSTVVEFVVAWRAPRWWGEGSPNAGGNRYVHMYSTRWRSAPEAASYLAEHRETLLARVRAWQAAVYDSTELPVWLRSALVNILHLITEDGLWSVSRDIGTWCDEELGLFGMNECPRGCAQIECIPCSFYGTLTLAYFFPELALSTLAGYRAYQYPNGEVPWVFGGVTAATKWGRKNHCEFIYPSPGYQTSLNGVCYVALADRYWRCTNDNTFLNEFYGSIRRAIEFTLALRPEYADLGQQVLAMPTGEVGSEWFEAPEPGWFGVTNHVGGLRLAMLSMGERLASAVGDANFAEQCRASRQAGQEVMEQQMWLGSYYRNCWDPVSGATSDLIFGYQMDGEWLARAHGLNGVFDSERVATTLDTIWSANRALSKYGAVNYAMQDGSLTQVRGYGPYSMFTPELFILAMTYLYAGQPERGEELARTCVENIECRQGLTWDQPNLFRGDRDTGERVFGADYYQNLILWALPAAFAGQELAAMAAPGGLVERVLRAAKASDVE